MVAVLDLGLPWLSYQEAISSRTAETGRVVGRPLSGGGERAAEGELSVADGGGDLRAE